MRTTCFMLVPSLANSSTVKMGEKSYSERSVDFQEATPRNIPEERTIQSDLRSACGTYKNFSVTIKIKLK
jgi:hypothetical protein